MKINLTKNILLLLFGFIFAVSLLRAQDSTVINGNKQNAVSDSTHKSAMKMTGMKNNKDMKMNLKNKDTVVKEKTVIDLNKLDKNKDGYIYQCPMDADALSDTPGIDPKCGMKLSKVTIKKAKVNLIKSGFKVR